MTRNKCEHCPFNQSANAFIDHYDEIARQGAETRGLDRRIRFDCVGAQRELELARLATNLCKGPVGDLETIGHQRCTNSVAIDIGSIAMDRGY